METGASLKIRLVALTSHLIKIFEKCVRNKIVEHMENHHLFSDKQHSFRKGRSCLSKLLAHHDWVLNNLAEGRNVDVVFLDFAKAFDKVDHGILLHKVKALSITGKLGVWIHAFLTGRLQAITVDGHRSEEAMVISGVPQDSVLGLLLFLIHMGGIGKRGGGSSLSSFPDNTSVSLPITTVEDVSRLQQDLETIYAQTATNNMQFNEEKFEMLRYGRNQDIKVKNVYTGGHEISAQPHAKCLGVYLSENCSFHHHTGETIRKAKGMADWVLRTFATRESQTMLTLWKTLIQPLLNYCSQLWSPHKTGEIQTRRGAEVLHQADQRDETSATGSDSRNCGFTHSNGEGTGTEPSTHGKFWRDRYLRPHAAHCNLVVVVVVLGLRGSLGEHYEPW